MGATGLVGQFCLKYLLDEVAYQKIDVLTRKPFHKIHPKLHQHLINFDKLEEWSHLLSSQDIFCCLGTTIKKAKTREAFRKVDYYYPHKIAKISQEQGAEQFLLISSLGANPSSKVFYNRVKGELEEAISGVPLKGIQIFRPSLLLGYREKFRLGEKMATIFLDIIKVFLLGNLKKYRPIAAETVARAMIEIAKVDLNGVNIFESHQIQFFYDRISKKNG